MIYPWHQNSWDLLIKADNYSRSSQIGNILIRGERSSGASVLAKLFCKYLLCFKKNTTKYPCEICQSCKWYESLSHPDFHSIQPINSKTITIEQIRNGIKLVSSTSAAGKGKVLFISPLEALTKKTSDALLKTVEDANDSISFIFSSTNPTQISKTLYSRTRHYIITTPNYLQKQMLIQEIKKSHTLQTKYDWIEQNDDLIFFDFEFMNQSIEEYKETDELFDIFSSDFINNTNTKSSLDRAISYCGKNNLLQSLLIDWQIIFCDTLISNILPETPSSSRYFSTNAINQWSQSILSPDKLFAIKNFLLLQKENLGMGLNAGNILNSCQIAWKVNQQ